MERYLLPLVILLLICGCAQNPPENVNDTPTTAQALNETTTSSQAPTTAMITSTNPTTTTHATSQSTSSVAPTTTTPPVPNVEKNKWVIEEGIRLENAFSPAVIKLDSGVYRMFASAKDGINAYVSPDGLKYVLEKKKILSEGYAPRVYKIRDNRYLMVYNNAEVLAGTGDRKKLYYKSASSSDGLNFFADMEIHLASQILRSPVLISSPEIINMGDKLRMYYTGDLFAPEIGNTNKKIKSAVSLDKGVTWMREDGTRINAEALDPCVVALPAGGYRMYYTAYDSADSDETMSVYSAHSTDGLNYTIEGKTLPADKGIRYMDPRVVGINGGYRMYYTEVTGPLENETTMIKSAVYITG